MLCINSLNKAAESGGRLSRDEWLRQALDVLAHEGPGRLHIQSLSESLGVSRGSFYWHFENREEFLSSLLAYWHREFTEPVPEAVETGGGSGQEKLLRLIRIVCEQDLTKYDMPIRSWAAQDPKIAKLVGQTDLFRLDYIRQLFVEVGFDGNELEIRARSFLGYMTLEKSLFDPLGRETELEQLEQLHAFFVRR